MFSKLALRNVTRSLKDYSVYFLTLTFGVSIFYVFNSLESQWCMQMLAKSAHYMVESILIFMNVFSAFVSVVLACLILYANTFLMKRRKRELGTYFLLGLPHGPGLPPPLSGDPAHRPGRPGHRHPPGHPPLPRPGSAHHRHVLRLSLRGGVRPGFVGKAVGRPPSTSVSSSCWSWSLPVCPSPGPGSSTSCRAGAETRRCGSAPVAERAHLSGRRRAAAPPMPCCSLRGLLYIDPLFSSCWPWAPWGPCCFSARSRAFSSGW